MQIINKNRTKMKKKEKKKATNIINTWMENNLSKSDYDNLAKDIPEKLGVSKRTWLNYRDGYSVIGISTLTELYKILLPYAIDKENFTITNLINQ